MVKKQEKVLTCVFFGAFIALFYAMNLIIPFFSDDLGYHFRSGLAGKEEYSSVFQVLADSVRGYWESAGRVVCTFFMRFYSGYLGEQLFNIFNTVMFAVLVFLIGLFCIPKRSRSSIAGWTTIFMFLYVLSTGEDELYYWGAGAGTYIVSAIMTMIYLLIFKKLSASNVNGLLQVFLILLGFILAFQNEGFAFPLSVATLLYLAYHRHTLGKTLIFFSFAFMLGSVMNVCSPSTLARSASANGVFTGMSLLKAIFLRAYWVLPSLRLAYLTIILFFTGLAVNRRKTLTICKENRVLIVLFLFAMVPPMVAGQGGRATYFAEFFAGLFLTKVVSTYYYKYSPLFVVIAICTLLYFSAVAYYTDKQWRILRQVESQYYSGRNVVYYKKIAVLSCFSRYIIDPIEFYQWHYVIDGYMKMRAFKEHSKVSTPLTAIPEDIHRQAFVNLKNMRGKNCIITPLRGGYLLSTTDSKQRVVSFSHLLFYHRQEDFSIAESEKNKINIPNISTINVFIKKRQGLLTVDSLKAE